ncbi:uncharacterized protein TRUGW13939_07913 [Talaromyces rugulosus]|uniref:Tat pathway signal sequence protein n=1 Tax=Talaromyces rugulosus TaxID=121627 RepID=A0A7H8R3C9_TALRU|nr:uncharacterized protein TRUGW13939_07913 [Talaromyces rugulosus]QKX60767.1 hypothetical protein TRUGW13939_07913 [Talaromyces rugulosus]
MSFESSKPDDPLMSGKDGLLEKINTKSKKSSSKYALFLSNLEGDIKVFMKYNSTFSHSPSPESDAAWESLFPKGKGFFKHPIIAPETSGLTVFHTLYCLNVLRQVYYAAFKVSLLPDHEEHSYLSDPHHVRYCFDYLQQNLMCSADTNLELVDRDLKGVTGWGFYRTCRDYEGVKAWAEKNWSNEL